MVTFSSKVCHNFYCMNTNISIFWFQQRQYFLQSDCHSEWLLLIVTIEWIKHSRKMPLIVRHVTKVQRRNFCSTLFKEFSNWCLLAISWVPKLWIFSLGHEGVQARENFPRTTSVKTPPCLCNQIKLLFTIYQIQKSFWWWGNFNVYYHYLNIANCLLQNVSHYRRN